MPRVEIVELGAWDGRLIAEYDGRLRRIRVNARALAALRDADPPGDDADVRSLYDFAVAHESFHHREATGSVRRCATRAERERAANAFAAERVALTPVARAFLARRCGLA